MMSSSPEARSCSTAPAAPPRPRPPALLLLLPVLLLGACGDPGAPADGGSPAGGADGAALETAGETPPPPEGDRLRVEEARAIRAPGAPTAAVYLTVLNPTAEDDVLLSASTPAARVAEVHETVEEGGMMRMEAFPEGMPVPAASTVVLRPGGKHLMLMALEEELQPGDEIQLALTFGTAGTVELTVPVVEVGS